MVACFSCCFLLIAVFLVSLVVVFFRRSKAASGTRAGQIRRPIEEILDNPDEIKYNKVAVTVPPPAVGIKVRFIAWLQHSVLGKTILGPQSKAQTGLDILSGEYIPERATFSVRMPIPAHMPTVADNNDAIQSAIKARKPMTRVSCISLNKAFRNGTATPTVVADTVLKYIDASNNLSPPLLAIVESDKGEVLRMAEESTKRWKEGKPLSLLDGVPVSIKGQFNCLPYQCTAGCSFQPTCAKDLPESVVVDRLKKAGAVIIGIANMQEAAAGTYGSNPNKGYKIARNPYNTKYFCGGSSSGSGCSVSAGLCPISMGSDDGGSIRIPAAFCGVFGLKPTFGLLDTEGFAPISQSVGVVGPLASSPIDIAVAMNIMCSENCKLDLSVLAKEDLDGLKMGIYWEYFEDADSEIVTMCKSAIRKLVDNGAVCHNIKIAELPEMKVAHLATAVAEFGNSLALDVDSKFGKVSGETLSMVGLGYTYSATDYINCQKQRTRTVEVMKNIFNEVDVIATPLAPIVAPKIPSGANDYGLLCNEYLDVSIRFTSLANFTGIPSIVVPVGLNKDGLPVSLQVMAPWYEEGRLLQIASVLEQSISNDMALPRVHYNLLRDD